MLADDQTFTGQNTFSDTAIFSDAGTDGSIQVANRIVHQGDEDTYIDFPSANTMDIVTGGVNILNSRTIGPGNFLTIGGLSTTIESGSITFAKQFF